MMNKEQHEAFIEIRWTSGSIDEARKISRLLVKDRWVIHAQIIPWIESIYLLDKQLETTQQSKITLLAKRDHYQTIYDIIKQNSSYEVVEITWIELDGGNKEYLLWNP